MDTIRRGWRKTPKTIRRVLVSIIGTLVIIAGCFMLVLPGPGWAAIFLGIAILASEFESANRLKTTLVLRFKHFLEQLRAKIKR